MSSTILIVDDDLQSLDATRRILEASGYSVTIAHHGQEALEFVRGGLRPDVVLTDLRMPKLGGIDFLRALRLLGDQTPVVLMSAFGTVTDAVEAMKLGAVDFLSKPFRRQALLQAISAAAARAKASRVSADEPQAWVEAEERLLTGKSDAMRRLRDQIARVAQTQATVLITGESGSGKELVARMLAELSARAQGPWVAVNCAALPENLLESELFGHEKGSFSGATSLKKGLFEAADGGTLFLDEMGDMPLSLQAKLLRVLQEGEIRRVGSTVTQKVNVRLIAATHQPLEERVTEGRFRADLLFRLRVVSLSVPALRDRKEDLADLAYSFLKYSARQHQKSVDRFEEGVIEALEKHSWPGNVRELSNAIERAVVFSEGNAVRLADLPEHISSVVHPDSPFVKKEMKLGSMEIRLGTPLKEVEDLLIQKTLDATDGDKQLTARLLGINERTIYRRLKEPSLATATEEE